MASKGKAVVGSSQKTLFSFFNKPAVTPASETPKSMSAVTTTQTSTADSSQESQNIENESILSMGQKIKVYWSQDNEWVMGTVQGYDASTKQHRIKYEDGVVEELCLHKEKVQYATNTCKLSFTYVCCSILSCKSRRNLR